jgi:PAS domain S-box-containing protein
MADADDVRATAEFLVRDAAAQVETERALLDAVVRQMPVGVLVADARTRRIVAANDWMAKLVGTDRRGVLVEDVYQPLPSRADGRPYARDELPLFRALTTGEAVEHEALVFDSPRGRRLLSVNAAPIRDADGKVVAAVAVIEDVTRREQREWAERDFVTNAAHELQTPLAAIVSAIEVLAAGAKDDPAARERFIEHIQREAGRLARLANALLVLARAQNLDERPARARVALRKLLDDVALSVHPAPGIEVRVECPARLAAAADRNLLEQALSTVVANAAKYTQAGEIRLRARRAGKRVEIEVADTGPGIPPGEEERVFDRFYRIGGRAADGFGLGLPIARQLVGAMGGTIELEAAKGGGTIARIALPAA